MSWGGNEDKEVVLMTLRLKMKGMLMVDNLEVWPDHERRLTLTKKDVCRGVHRLRCRCAHRHLHDGDGGDLGVGVNELDPLHHLGLRLNHEFVVST